MTPASHTPVRRALGALLVAISCAAAADSVDLDAVMERNFLVSKVSTLRGSAKIVLTSAEGGVRKRDIELLSKLQSGSTDSKILIRFDFPADVKDTTFLQIENSSGDDDLWIYLPALRKVRRLVANNKRDSFVGTDFSYGDILPSRPALFSHVLLREEPFEGDDCYVVESRPRSAEDRAHLGYDRRVSWIRKDNFLERKVLFYDDRDALVKTELVTGHRRVEDRPERWIAMQRTMTNEQSGHRTEFELDDIAVGGPVSDSSFNVQALRRR